MTLNKKVLLVAMAAAMPWLGAHAQTNAELVQQIQALQAQLKALQTKVEGMNQVATDSSRQLNRLQEQVEQSDENAFLSGFKGVKISGSIDPTYIYNQRADDSGFSLMRNIGAGSPANAPDFQGFGIDNSLFGNAMLEFSKETEDGVNWTLRLAPRSGSDFIHEASFSVPISDDRKVRLIAGQVPDWGGYEYTWGHMNPMVTHNLLFDFTLPSSYIGAGLNFPIGDLDTKVMLANIDGERGRGFRTPGLVYRGDYELSEFSGFGFAGVHSRNTTNLDMFEVDYFRDRGDWLFQAQGSVGRVKGWASNGGDAKWWGFSSLTGYKITPRLQALARFDYINNSKNGGGLYGTDLANDPNGNALDSRSGFGPSIDNTTMLPFDPNKGVNRYALSTGLKYLVNDNVSLKFEVRYDRANGNVFYDVKSGTYKKSNVLLGGAVVFSF